MKTYIKISAFLLFFSLLTSCGNNNSSTETTIELNEGNNNLIEVTQAQFQQGDMALSTMEEKSFPVVVNVNGMIDVPPENRAVVNATMGGYIKSTPFLIGDQVVKGQVLVTLENPEFIALQQSYLEIHEQLSYLKAEYERQQTMKTENITSQKSFLKAESDYKTAIASYNGLQKQLQLLSINTNQVKAGNFTSIVNIYAPISGYITKVQVTKGSYVSPATAIMELIDNDHIHLELSVFEKDVMKLKKGQEITFKIPEASQETFKAEVHLVSTSIDENRTVKVHAHINDSTQQHFLVGMFVEAAIITSTVKAKAIPTDAFVMIDDVANVMVLDKQEGATYYFRQEQVQVFENYEGYYRVAPTEKMHATTQFLSKGVFNLLGE